MKTKYEIIFVLYFYLEDKSLPLDSGKMTRREILESLLQILYILVKLF